MQEAGFLLTRLKTNTLVIFVLKSSALNLFYKNTKLLIRSNAVVKNLSRSSRELKAVEDNDYSWEMCKKRFKHKNSHKAYEPRYEKTGFLHMRKQRRRSALQ